MDKNLLQIILDNQAKMSEDIVDMKVLLAKQEESITYHIKRTDLAEENMVLLREQMSIDLKPIKSHVAFVNTALKIVGGLSVLVSIGASIVKILSYFAK